MRHTSLAASLVFIASSTTATQLQQSTFTTTSTTTSTTYISTAISTLPNEAQAIAATAAKDDIRTTTIIITTTPTTNPSNPSSSSSSSSYSPPSLRDAILNSTNYFRHAYLASPVTWNTTLSQYAQSYAAKCIWAHSGGPYGENLALGFTTPTLGVDAWASEEKHYDYEHHEFSERTGHFTQLVWRATREVGCGAVLCGSGGSEGGDGKAEGWLLVCEYYPPGNVIGEFVENVRKAGMGSDGQLGFGGADKAAVGLWRVSMAVGVLVGVFVAGLI